jgi:hypothetical protein
MIDTVGTSTLQSQALRTASQAAVAAFASGTAAVPSKQFITSRIRVDNLLNVAILEYRSSDTGEVVRQYPTDPQMRAIQRAAQLEAVKISISADAPVKTDVSTEDGGTQGAAFVAPAFPAAAPSSAAPASKAAAPAPVSTTEVFA